VHEWFRNFTKAMARNGTQLRNVKPSRDPPIRAVHIKVSLIDFGSTPFGLRQNNLCKASPECLWRNFPDTAREKDVGQMR
jgi:hypothetical protein